MKLESGREAFLARSEKVEWNTPHSKLKLRVRFYAALLLLDSIAITAMFAVANIIRFDDPLALPGVNILAVLLPLYVAIAANRRVFGGIIFTRWREAAWRAATSFGAAVTALLFVAFYLHAAAQVSREVFTIGSLGSLVLLLALRWGVRVYGRQLLGEEPYAQVVIRDGVEMECGPHVVSINASALSLTPNIADPNALDRIGRLLKRADRVIVACPMDRRAAWAAVLKGANIHGEIVTPELRAIGSLGAGTFEGESTLMVSIPSLDLRGRAAKRGLDLAIAGFALLLLAPLMLITAIAVRLESPGPILFVQPRLGRGNRLFPMYKFRSMRADQCDAAGATSTARGDKRVTRVGRIIRATSIDELPQLLNVVAGDMSIVGPRPHALGSLAGDKLFWEVDQRYWHRHAAKPGITGLAQVRGFRGATHMQSDLVSRLQADLDYLNGWSLWRDISILLATARVVTHKNAY